MISLRRCLLLSAGIGLVAIFTLSCGPLPPTQEIADAQAAIEAARVAGARELSPEEYNQADGLLLESISQMEAKKYEKSRNLALRSRKLAQEAERKALERGVTITPEAISPEKEEEPYEKRVEEEGIEVEEITPEEAVKVQKPTLIAEGEIARLPKEKLVIEDKELVLKRAYFDYDKYNLRPDARQSIEGNSVWLLKHPEVIIQLEGHCDERGTNEYNLALGERRAQSVKEYLTLLGMDKKRISTISFGEEVPLNPGHSEEAWAKNRRVEFVIISP